MNSGHAARSLFTVLTELPQSERSTALKFSHTKGRTQTEGV